MFIPTVLFKIQHKFDSSDTYRSGQCPDYRGIRFTGEVSLQFIREARFSIINMNTIANVNKYNIIRAYNQKHENKYYLYSLGK